MKSKSFLRIGINLTAIDPNYLGGISTYTFGLLDGLLNVRDSESLILFVSRDNKYLFKKYAKIDSVTIIELPSISKFSRLLQKASLLVPLSCLYLVITNLISRGIAKLINENCNICYYPTTLITPYNLKVPTIVSMHDIQHVHYPEFFSLKERINRYHQFKLSAKYATFIQASSEFIRDDLSHNYHVDKRKIWVIEEGVDIKEFSQRIDTAFLYSTYKTPESFIFFPAQLWKHKNHITVLKAIKLLKDGGISIPLVLTGAKFSGSTEILEYIEDNNLDNVYYLGKVPFKDLKALYQKATIFITAVLYESSSLPVREAACSQTAIIASDIGPNRETAKVLSMQLFPPKDEVKLSEQLYDLWQNPLKRREQIEYNSKKINHYSWDNVATLYLSFIKDIKLL